MELVRELHLRGYEQLRISPGMSPSGMHWRCDITPVSNISPTNGALIMDFEGPIARYSSANEDKPFEWPDGSDRTPSVLADKFIESFPAIAAAGFGQDPAYVTWYREMLEATRGGTFPIAYADADLPDDHLQTVGGREVKVPMPPCGPNQLFDATVARIEKVYHALRHTWGWRFLYTARSTLLSNNGILFLGLNPAGLIEPSQESCEQGNAYLDEKWGEEQHNQLQVQVQLFYRLIAEATNRDATALMRNSLAANFCPFCAASYAELNEPSQSLTFSYELWSLIFPALEPKVVVTMGNEVRRNIDTLLLSMGSVIVDERYLDTGWGKIKYRLANVTSGNREILLVGLPHLSRFRIFGRGPTKFKELQVALKRTLPRHGQ